MIIFIFHKLFFYVAIVQNITQIKQELRFPWLARLEHLDHRMWIEEKNINALWMEKASFIRFSSLYNDKLIQLAIKNYELRQSIYKQELEELKRYR